MLPANHPSALEVLNEKGLGDAWGVYNTPLDPDYPEEYEETTIRDIVARLVRYGTLSEKQLSFLRTLLHRIEDRATATPTVSESCPTGPATIEGTVLTIKGAKMLVLDKRGFKVYGYRVGNAEKGDNIRFNCTVKPTEDPLFGFFNHASGWEVVSEQ